MALREMPHKLRDEELMKSQCWTLPADNICGELSRVVVFSLSINWLQNTNSVRSNKHHSFLNIARRPSLCSNWKCLSGWAKLIVGLTVFSPYPRNIFSEHRERHSMLRKKRFQSLKTGTNCEKWKFLRIPMKPFPRSAPLPLSLFQAGASTAQRRGVSLFSEQLGKLVNEMKFKDSSCKQPLTEESRGFFSTRECVAFVN